MSFYIPTPDEKIFSIKKLERFIEENQNVDIITHIDYSEGLKIYKKNWLYPTKGFVTPEAMEAVNTAKKIFISLLFTLNPLMLISRKYSQKLISNYVRPAYWIIQPYITKVEYRTSISQETEKIFNDQWFFFTNSNKH